MIHKRLHHVGIIVPTREKADALMEMYGLEVDYEGPTPYNTYYIFTKMNPDESESAIEFLIPEPGSKLSQFNNGKGGIAHICFEVDDIDAVCAEFKAKGCELLHDECEVSDGTMKINFVKPKSSHGILVEFMQIIDPEE